MPEQQRLTAEVGGRRLRVSSLDKVLYPQTGMTKGEVIDYYVRVADALLPQLADRPVTRVRFPHGVGAESFFEKNAPAGTPAWVSRSVLPADGVFGSGSTQVDWPFVDDLAALVWMVNLGALELHTPQWRARGRHTAPRPDWPDRLVIDLDPGAGVGLAECSQVALVIRDQLRQLGIDPLPVTSGSKGLHLYAALPGDLDAATVSAIAHDLAKAAALALPTLVVQRMARDQRVGKVFVDWSQNAAAKTTVTPYSLRGTGFPQVAAPRSWEEIEAGSGLEQLSPSQVLDRLDRFGDLLAKT